MVRILVSGDLHMGRQPTHLPEGIDGRRLSASAGWLRLVEAAISEQVHAVVLSGDLIDRENRNAENLADELHLAQGINIVYGPNASGKTTTARAINHLLWPHLSKPEAIALAAHLQLDSVSIEKFAQISDGISELNQRLRRLELLKTIGIDLDLSESKLHWLVNRINARLNCLSVVSGNHACQWHTRH